MSYNLSSIISSQKDTSQNSGQNPATTDNSTLGSYNLNNQINNNQPAPNPALQDKLAPPYDKTPNNINPDNSRNTIPFLPISNIISIIERFGLPSIWEKSIPCPCINPVTNAPRSDCPLCHGRGLIFSNPVQLQIAYQSNDKGPYNGPNGMFDLGTTIATPQTTDSGIENGISFRDRLTVTNMSLSQSLMFNLTSKRITNGVYVPYKLSNGIEGIDRAITLNGSSIQELIPNEDFTFNKSTNTLNFSKKFLGKNISLNLSVVPRYYVADLSKETRYLQVSKYEVKKQLEGNGNPLLTNYIKNNYVTSTDQINYYRAPKKLILKREDLYVGMVNFEAQDNTDKPNNYIDPKRYADGSINDLLGGN